MERYITFIRNEQTGEEFVSTMRHAPKGHDTVLRMEASRYSSPAYKVHTTYTETELADILDTLTRWTGESRQARTSYNLPIGEFSEMQKRW